MLSAGSDIALTLIPKQDIGREKGMAFPDSILNAASFVFRRAPSFRGVGRIYRLFNSAILRIGANPIASAKMKDGTKILVDLRTKTEVGAFYCGRYDPDLMDAVRSLVAEDSCFLDVGANIGFYTVAIAETIRSKGGSGKVIAFEPFDGNHDRLLKNISLNGLEGYCSTRKIGLSNATADSEITLREDFSGGSGTGNASIPINTEFDEGFKTVPIKLDRLDNIWMEIGKNGNRRIDVIKMDIEGHEDYCLQGGQQTIQANRPVILMEVNKPYYVARGVELDSVFLQLIPENYAVFRRNGATWQVIGSLDECSNIDNVFLVPEERMGQCRKVLSMT